MKEAGISNELPASYIFGSKYYLYDSIISHNSTRSSNMTLPRSWLISRPFLNAIKEGLPMMQNFLHRKKQSYENRSILTLPLNFLANEERWAKFCS